MANRHLSAAPDHPIPVLLQQESGIHALKTNLARNHRIRLDSRLIIDLFGPYLLTRLARRVTSVEETPT